MLTLEDHPCPFWLLPEKSGDVSTFWRKTVLAPPPAKKYSPPWLQKGAQSEMPVLASTKSSDSPMPKMSAPSARKVWPSSKAR